MNLKGNASWKMFELYAYVNFVYFYVVWFVEKMFLSFLKIKHSLKLQAGTINNVISQWTYSQGPTVGRSNRCQLHTKCETACIEMGSNI